MANKRCSKCKDEKDSSLFANDAARPDGKYPSCKLCASKINNPPRTSGEKECCRCGEEKHVSCFYIRKVTSDGLCYWCKECDATYQQAWTRQRKYGLSAEEYQEILKTQDYKCLICECSEEDARIKQKKEYSFVIDHCHSSGTVRGLLCNHCNIMLGLAEDSVNILQKAILYLERN